LSNILFDNGIFIYQLGLGWEEGPVKHISAIKKKLIVAISTWLLVAFLLVISTTLAIFTGEANKNLTIQVSNIYVQSDVYFVQDNLSLYRPQLGTGVDERGMIYVDVRDPNANNYIGRLKINIQYKGIVEGYVRIKFVEEWHRTTTTNVGTLEEPSYVVTNAIIRNVIPPYSMNLADPQGDPPDLFGWYDNLILDDYWYYTEQVKSLNTGVFATIPVIEGFVDDAYFPVADYEGTRITRSYSLRIGIYVEAVQASRYKAVWSMTSLPFEDEPEA
jgi:hypothetical protein